MMAEWKKGCGTSHIWQSWQSGSAEVELHNFWQLKQSVSGEADLHIFGSPDRTSADSELKIFRSPGRTEVWREVLHIFGINGNQGRAEMRKRSFRPLEVLAERKGESWTSDLGSQGKTEVRKRNVTSLEEFAEQKCGTELMSHHG